FAGTINQEGAIEVETTRPAGDSTIARIVRVVREAQAHRAPSELFVERFARTYTPVVLVLALLLATMVPLILGHWSHWFYQALVLLVIACPCALVISTPVSIVAALARAARHGVLVKGGVSVELVGKLAAIAFDKTGTLTEGRPCVADIRPRPGHSAMDVLTLASAIERRSEHPIARAIVKAAEARGCSPQAVEDFQAVKGKGATARVNGCTVWIGSHRYLEERGQESPAMHRDLEELGAGGRTVVAVGKNANVLGFITLSDRLRPAAVRAVADLKAAGVERVVLLTGDNEPTARAIAASVGVEEFRTELLPEDKVRVIEELIKRYGTVGMVGDGINDAPALARASVGIAMGAGTDVALETADIALMSDNLAKLPWLVHHSRRTLRTIRQNIAAALAVKAVFVLLTVLGQASLWAAIAADMGVSLLVVLNALRLLSGHAEPGHHAPADAADHSVSQMASESITPTPGLMLSRSTESLHD
ncbi:MAG: heavy metal translocating P-type ATPase, partial [Planctomycetota bacterium]